MALRRRGVATPIRSAAKRLDALCDQTGPENSRSAVVFRRGLAQCDRNSLWRMTGEQGGTQHTPTFFRISPLIVETISGDAL